MNSLGYSYLLPRSKARSSLTSLPSIIEHMDGTTSVEPTPVDSPPTSVEPTPTSVEPTSVEPTPVEPTSVEPTSVEPTSVEPTPVVDASPQPANAAETNNETVSRGVSTRSGRERQSRSNRKSGRAYRNLVRNEFLYDDNYDDFNDYNYYYNGSPPVQTRTVVIERPTVQVQQNPQTTSLPLPGNYVSSLTLAAFIVLISILF